MTDLFLPKEKRHIRYDFSAVEIHSLSLQLANKTKEQAALLEEKKTVTSQYSARQNEITATVNKLSNQVADGYEMRETEFTLEYHKPSQGMKTLTPTNGGDKIEEKMLPWDYNLFNQESDVSKEEKESLNDRQTQEAGNKKDLFPWQGDKTGLNDAPIPEADPIFSAADRMHSTKKSKVAHIPQADPEAMKRINNDEGVGNLIKAARKDLRGQGSKKNNTPPPPAKHKAKK